MQYILGKMNMLCTWPYFYSNKNKMFGESGMLDVLKIKKRHWTSSKSGLSWLYSIGQALASVFYYASICGFLFFFSSLVGPFIVYILDTKVASLSNWEVCGMSWLVNIGMYHWCECPWWRLAHLCSPYKYTDWHWLNENTAIVLSCSVCLDLPESNFLLCSKWLE